ncbi:hypothetical protein [Saccharopolyspora spinosa]|uniref:Uncharacterized protein n=1 Tax=Saccharopolyspora spinosa TaxID=60894 RepID=A0A2N3Y833_SACSN|nr:hypothetical protein [Saccharopolyspora spinosa]PKW19070.1 hypothetical protein A8926_7216 [Saccharopolyspora spinosa]
MRPATNGAAAQKKPPRVLRWIIVLLLIWLVTGGYFLVSTEVTIWSRTFGSGEATADPVAHVELDQGQPFGLAAQRDEYVKCQVIPRAGEAREFIPDRPANSLRSSRLPGPEPAWFSGPAEVRCTGPATVLLPERYDKTGLNVLYALMTASSLMIVVVLGQIARRVRFSNRLHARV